HAPEMNKGASMSMTASARLTEVVRWGPLEILAEIGRGGYGAVFQAWDPRLEREVALKLLRADDAARGMASAIIAEGRLLARMRHANVVAVYGGEVFDGHAGIWMELIDGKTLEAIVREQGPFSASEAAIIGRDLCAALAAVHRRDLLHRDVKAENVM